MNISIADSRPANRALRRRDRAHPRHPRRYLLTATALIGLAVLATPANGAPPQAEAAANVFVTDEDVVLANTPFSVTDPDGDVLDCSVETAPGKGTVSIDPPTPSCIFTYAPGPNQNGFDKFTFAATDGANRIVVPATINITPTNDPPEPRDVVQGVPVPRGGEFTGTLIATDRDGDPLTFDIPPTPSQAPRLANSGVLLVELGDAATGAARGTVELLDPSTGQFRYRAPDDQFQGEVVLSYTVADRDEVVSGSYRLTVSGEPNKRPTATPARFETDEDQQLQGQLAGTDQDNQPSPLTFELAVGPEQGELEFRGTGAFTYTPALNANLAVSFSFTVFDGSSVSEAAMVDIRVTARNDLPSIAPGPDFDLFAPPNQPFSLTVQVQDIDGDALTVSVSGCPAWALPCVPINLAAAQGASQTLSQTLVTALAGTPPPGAASPTAPIRIVVADGSGESAQEPFQIIVPGLTPTTIASPAGGTFNAPVPVTLSCRDTGGGGSCAIRYTLDAAAAVEDFLTYAGTPIVIEGSPDQSSAQSLRYFATAGGVTESPPKQADFLIDRAGPDVALLTPNGARVLVFPAATGTAADGPGESGLARLEIELTDGTNYLASLGPGGFAFSPIQATFEVPVVGGNWSFQPPDLPWPAGRWTLTASAVDNAGNATSTSVEFSYVDQEQLAPTELTVAPSTPSALAGAPLEVFGQLRRVPENALSLAGREVVVTVDNPGGSPVPLRPELAPPERFSAPVLLDTEGKFGVDLGGKLLATGLHHFQASFAGTSQLFASTATGQVVIGPSAGYAVIIQGRIESGEGLGAHDLTTDRVYAQLIARGLRPEHIKYFAYDYAPLNPAPAGECDEGETDPSGVDAKPTKCRIQNALEVWARQRLQEAPAPMYVISVGHAEPSQFFVFNESTGTQEIVDPNDFNQWLTELEAGLPADIVGVSPRVVIVGACYSGSFITAELSKPGLNRVIIASAAGNEESYRGPLEFDDAAGGRVRGGEFFVETLLKFLGDGQALPEAFAQASRLTALYTQRGAAKQSQSRFIDGAAQHPLYDDNGDAVASNLLDQGDGAATSSVYLGFAPPAESGAPVETDEAAFVQVTGTLHLPAGQSTAALWGFANHPGRVDTAWVEIRAPRTVLEGQGGTAQLENNLSKVFLTRDEATGRYEVEDCRLDNGRGCFENPGRYDVFYFVIDTITARVSTLASSVVHVNRQGNRRPDGFALLAPLDGVQTTPTMVLDWGDATDLDNDRVTYQVVVATDPDLNDVVLRREQLRASSLVIEPSSGIRGVQTFYWGHAQSTNLARSAMARDEDRSLRTVTTRWDCYAE